MSARLLLIRHAQSEWNACGRWQGWADPPLSPAGVQACRAAASDPALDEVETVASSDLRRARSSAELLAQGRGWDPVLTLRGLRERSAGEWTGLTRHEIERGWPGALATTPAPIPGGEAIEALIARAVAALHRVAERFAGATVLVVSHGAFTRAVIHELGLGTDHVPNLGGLWIDAADGRLTAGPLVAALGTSAAEPAG